ncbi:MAG: hypothetical protein LBP98_01190, partial [Tannerella sp.]|nr:hypothetical protein [Tannerella sp.]
PLSSIHPLRPADEEAVPFLKTALYQTSIRNAAVHALCMPPYYAVIHTLRKAASRFILLIEIDDKGMCKIHSASKKNEPKFPFA